MNFSANALLAIGASPLMSSEPEEMEEIAGEADALVINIGCLERTQAEAMFKAASVVHTLGKPWVLDPAGVGLSRLRRATADRLVKEYRPALIRGNATEIMILSGADIKSRGLDSRHTTSEALEYASRLAVESGVTMVQLREKSLDTRSFIDRALRLKKLLAPYGVPLIINDRVDVALASDGLRRAVRMSVHPAVAIGGMNAGTDIVIYRRCTVFLCSEAIQWLRTG